MNALNHPSLTTPMALRLVMPDVNGSSGSLASAAALGALGSLAPSGFGSGTGVVASLTGDVAVTSGPLVHGVSGSSRTGVCTILRTGVGTG